MGFSNNKITAPISLSDVATALGETNLDVGYLCSSSKVKAWAKYKPVKDDSPITQDGWWDGGDGKCGFTIPSYGGTTGSLYNDNMVGLFTDDGVNGWVYNQPKAGDWLRLTDFEGYYALAAAPYSKLNDATLVKGRDSVLTIVPLASNNTRDDVLKLSDFPLLYNPNTEEAIYHFGAFIVGYNNNEAQYRRVISDFKDNHNKPIIGATVDIPINDLPVGTYTIYCILADQPIGYNSETGLADRDMRVTAIPCPGIAPATLVIADMQAPYLLTANYIDNIDSVQPTFTFKNQSNKVVKIKNLTAKYLIGQSWDNVAGTITWGNDVTEVVGMDTTVSSETISPLIKPALIKPTSGGGTDCIGIELTVVVLDSNGNETSEVVNMRATSRAILNFAGNINPLNE